MPRSRPSSTISSVSASASASSLMQDVPGAFPGAPQGPIEPDEDAEEATYLTLSQAVHARRAEYVRPKHVRIKIGTWNVAAYKGAEKDVGGWFVEGKGVEEALAGLNVHDGGALHRGDVPEGKADTKVEDVAAQEARYQRKQPTLPKGDTPALPGGDDIGLYVLGLQEVVDITSATEALRPYTDPSAAKKWRDAMEAALPSGYQLVAEQQLIGLLLLVYASPDIAPEIKASSTTSVGTGLMGYMGNKGAVTARIVLGETTRIVFVNCHLGAGADKAALERRNWDAQQIVQRTKFEPIQDVMDLTQTTGEQIGDEDVAFWCGDLNYRLEGIPGEDVRRLLMLHTRNEYDLSQQSAKKIDNEIAEAKETARQRDSERMSTDSASSNSTRLSNDGTQASTISTAPSTIIDEVAASEDPTSLQTTLDSLLPHDELHQQMKARVAFHDGWREGPITFLPTYKYDPGSVGVFDTSEKKRAPSWCDRILYRTRKDRLAYQAKVKEEQNAKKKDEEMRASGLDEAGEEESILYDYDPDADGVNPNYDEQGDYDEYDDDNDGVVITKEGFEDEVHLEYYTAHQRVLSSDHKPLNAIFGIKFDAVVPELKAKIHAEVAKDLDKAENEGRPNVTVVVDQHNETAEHSEEDTREFEGAWFGSVRWGQAKHRNLTIANTSRVPAKFTFIERPVGAGQTTGVAPSWLNMTLNGSSLSSSSNASSLVTVEPGETVPVELEIRILDVGLSQALNDGSQALDDILVLRVEGGRDHFIPIRAKWSDTSLGQTIDKLIRVPEGGIRWLQNQRPKDKKRGASDASRDAGSNNSSNNEPVRSSAPRELFRLTEALEDVITRVVAEWEMTNSSSEGQAQEQAPWETHPAWPFDERCWSERSTSQWQGALSEAVNALDTDQPIEKSLPAELPRMQKCYILANLLMLFLESMPDGIVMASLWTQIDAYFAQTEKAKRKSLDEDVRSAIQEILSSEPSHSIAFILITSMLDRVVQETGRASKEAAPQPLSPGKKPSALRRMTGGLGKVPAASRRSTGAAAMAKVFAGAVVRVGDGGGKKGGAVAERRRVEVIEVFLRRDEEQS